MIKSPCSKGGKNGLFLFEVSFILVARLVASNILILNWSSMMVDYFYAT